MQDSDHLLQYPLGTESLPFAVKSFKPTKTDAVTEFTWEYGKLLYPGCSQCIDEAINGIFMP